jgi:L-fucose mutarotase
MALLKGIDPILNADVLHALASMGHGDALVICDANFPAASVASQTVLGTHIELGVDGLTALNAVLTVFPIDTYDLEIPPVQGMQIVGAPDELPDIIKDATPLIEGLGASIALVERHSFYETASKAFVIFRTLETRFYGNFILRKGVVNR